jgi:hypothetical protein
MADIQPETVYVTAPSPGAEATRDAPISNNLTPPPDATSGGGLVLSPSSGTPGSTPSNPQPTPPPKAKETFSQGFRRGASGEKYVVDSSGNISQARTTAPSAGGTFGSILAGVVQGALSGAMRARAGGIPSSELGGGAGAGVAGAVQDAQQRDLRNRGAAQQNFSNQQAIQKMSREQAESAATINHLAAQTASELSATQRANDEHPLNMALKKAGLDESAVNIQKGHQELITNSLAMMQTLVDNGIEPTAIPTNWNDAKPHVKDITTGRLLPIYNGMEGEDAGVGMFNVSQLRNTPIMKDVSFKTFTADKDGNPVPKINTLPAGTSAMSYVESAMEGKRQLKEILSAQSVKQAAEMHKADIREKNASANQKNAEATKAQTETTQIANLNPKGSEGLSGDAYLKTLPQPTQQLFQSVAEGRNTAFTLQNRKGELTPAGEAFIRAYPDFDVAKSKEYPKLVAEFTTGQTGKSLVSQGTAINHARAAYDNTGASSFIPGTAENKRYNADVTYVSEELGKYLKAGVATKEEVHAIEDSLQSHIPWIRKPALENAAKIIEGRRSELQQQWKNGQVRPSYQPPMPNISPEAEANLAYLRSGGRSQQPAQQAQPQGQQTQQKPTQQVFNPVAWQAAHPGQDVNAAIAYAKSQGIQVKQ